LESTDIVVGTPGRLLDHIQRKTIDLSEVKIVVLDEADMMLDMGFLDDVGRIIEECPEENRQTMLFSATMPREIIELSDRYLKDPVEVVAQTYVDPKMLRQVYYDIYPDNLKFSLLTHLLKKEHPGMIMVFCNTRRNVDFVVENLKNQGIDSIAIHGGLTQNKRDNVMEKFHAKTVEVLVCTDVAARGLDIKGVSHVYNYDIPKEAKEYVHRAGRTARAGEAGMVINLVATRDGDNFRAVLSEHDMKIEEVRMPKIERVRIIRLDDRFGNRNEGRESGFRPSPGGRFSHRDEGHRSEHSEGRTGGYSSERGGERSGYRSSGPRRNYSNREEEAKTPPEIKRGKARPKTHVRQPYRSESKGKR
jgi:ATP-dependent RNA helicase DeaD